MLQIAVVAVELIQPALPYLDLVDEAGWEDSDKVEIVSLEAAGLEEEGAEPTCGGFRDRESTDGGILDYINWFYEEEVE